MLYQSHLQRQNREILPQLIVMPGIYYLTTSGLKKWIKNEAGENPLVERLAEDEITIEKTADDNSFFNIVLVEENLPSIVLRMPKTEIIVYSLQKYTRIFINNSPL